MVFKDLIPMLLRKQTVFLLTLVFCVHLPFWQRQTRKEGVTHSSSHNDSLHQGRYMADR